MEFSLRALDQLIAVVEEGSFTRAAKRMHVAQPWLSARIRQLEELAGLRLLDRSTRTIRPTPDGEIFLAQARIVVREARHLANLSRDLTEGAGTLRVGAAPYTYFMPERQALLEGFAAAYPGISLEIENGQDPQLRQAVLQGDLDASIVTGSAPEGCDHLLLRPSPVTLMLPREHPLATLERIPLEALAGVTIAAWRRSANPVAWDETVGHMAAAGAEILPLPEPMRRAQIDLARRERLILAVLGTLPDYDEAADMKDDSAWVTRPMTDQSLRADVTLIRQHQDRPRRALDRFWSYARRNLSP
ncbi:DNA-binding transcriptional regulator, LysR family [Sphingobium faniae]|nr:DNA-binding transcriptional regulator, LysR family [Sphingobium faniae]